MPPMLLGIQRAAAGAVVERRAQVHSAAARGMATPSSLLAHAARIQRAFGRRDVSANFRSDGRRFTRAAHASKPKLRVKGAARRRSSFSVRHRARERTFAYASAPRA